MPHSGRKRKRLQMGPSEVSTVMGAKVQVTSHGTVRVISNHKLKKMEKEKSQKNIENAKKRSEKKASKRKVSDKKGKEMKKARKQQVNNDKLEEKEAEELCGSDSEAKTKENKALKMRRRQRRDLFRCRSFLRHHGRFRTVGEWRSGYP